MSHKNVKKGGHITEVNLINPVGEKQFLMGIASQSAVVEIILNRSKVEYNMLQKFITKFASYVLTEYQPTSSANNIAVRRAARSNVSSTKIFSLGL